MISDPMNVIKAFEHLIDVLHDEGVDSEIISTVESARELFEEELDQAESDRDEM